MIRRLGRAHQMGHATHCSCRCPRMPSKPPRPVPVNGARLAPVCPCRASPALPPRKAAMRRGPPIGVPLRLLSRTEPLSLASGNPPAQWFQPCACSLMYSHTSLASSSRNATTPGKPGCPSLRLSGSSSRCSLKARRPSTSVPPSLTMLTFAVIALQGSLPSWTADQTYLKP